MTCWWPPGGETVEEHMELVQRVFDRLREVGLKCHPEKCCFAAQSVEYLGMWLRPGVVSPQVAKVAAIAALPRPTDETSVKAFSGVVNYYRQFIPNCSRLQAPLNELTKKGVAWVWGAKQEGAFVALKAALQGEPVLVLPWRGRPFKVRCDWSKKGIGGVMLQEDEAGAERVVAYGSRSCNGAESRYSSFEGELLAAVYFVRLWRQYLYGERFVLESDHQPLKWILTNTKITGKLARWALMLSEFDFEVVHKPGVDNEMDCLSRFPAESSHDSTGVRHEGELEGSCVWSAATCLAWTPLLSGTQWRVPAAGGCQQSGPRGPAQDGVQLGAAALSPQGSRQESAGDSRGGSALHQVGLAVGGSAGSGSQGAAAASGGGAEQQMTWGVAGLGVEAQGAVDVWEDTALLSVLQGRGYPPSCGRAERDRLQHRARQYVWQGGHLERRLANGSTRVVPQMAERGPLIRDVHQRAGHFGVRKTQSLLRPHYWWVELSSDVARKVRQCAACDRVKASFNAKHPTLQPLPIKGMFYRWGLDFAGPLPKSCRGNQYVLVMVEHFSKHIILVPTQDEEPNTVAEASAREVLTRFGSCAEVVTDRGGEFSGEFQECLDAALIDHRAFSISPTG
jgi:hypothetical protein